MFSPHATVQLQLLYTYICSYQKSNLRVKIEMGSGDRSTHTQVTYLLFTAGTTALLAWWRNDIFFQIYMQTKIVCFYKKVTVACRYTTCSTSSCFSSNYLQWRGRGRGRFEENIFGQNFKFLVGRFIARQLSLRTSPREQLLENNSENV